MQTDTDDNGTIYKATTPTSTVSGNRYEAKNIDVLADIFGLQVIDDTTHSRKIVGQKITTVELPRVVLIIETIPTTSQPTVEKAYVVDTGLTTDIVLNFLDTVRANGVGNTSFTFTTNKNGGRFRVIPTA
ncbi:MAG: hypothetical protein LBG52_04190 [Candidatus Peribacteria bacterium]|nr:hypothetical protein [Candidatus Peribacteria bacterium]